MNQELLNALTYIFLMFVMPIVLMAITVYALEAKNKLGK